MSRKISLYDDDDVVMAAIREVAKRHRDVQWAEFSLMLAIEEMYKTNSHLRIIRYAAMFITEAITLPFGKTRWYHRKIKKLMKQGLTTEEAAHKIAYRKER